MASAADASVPVPDLAHPPRLTPGRALAALAVGWLVCLALIPVEIGRAFGLPAHPLLVHVPVVFGPILALVTLALALKPSWRARYGLAWGAFAVVTLLGTVLTAGAGEALWSERFGRGANGPIRLGQSTIQAHRDAGETLRVLMFVLVALILVVLLVDHLRATGRWRTSAAAATALVVLAALVGLGAGFFTVRTGHLGAEATWSRQDGPRGRAGGMGGAGTPPGQDGSRPARPVPPGQPSG